MIVNDAAIDVVCGENTLLRLDAVQMEGRKRISAQEFARGARLRSGDRFDD
jgi:methionyl-tRNA formyltransferase